MTTMVIARAVGDQDLQLARHAVGRQHPLHHADALRARLRVDVRDRRPVRHLHGGDAGRHLHPRHLLHRRPHPLRGLRRQHLRHLRRHLLLVPEDVRPHDERDARQDPLLAHVHLLQLHVLPDAHPRHRRPHAPHLQPDAVRVPEAAPALERRSSRSARSASARRSSSSSSTSSGACSPGKARRSNPWHANTLEWEAPTPPPHGNFPGRLPTVYRGPYEYRSPLVAEDYLPQARRLEPQAAGSARRTERMARAHHPAVARDGVPAARSRTTSRSPSRGWSRWCW